MQSIKKNIPGLAVCLAIAVPSWLLGKLVPVIGGPVFSILIGMLIALFWTPGASCKPGIGFTSKKILQAAVVLLGFGLNLNVVLQTGKQSLPIIVCTITTSLLVAFALHKLLHIDGETGTLIGVGSSICGGSAIAATASVMMKRLPSLSPSSSFSMYWPRCCFRCWGRPSALTPPPARPSVSSPERR